MAVSTAWECGVHLCADNKMSREGIHWHTCNRRHFCSINTIKLYPWREWLCLPCQLQLNETKTKWWTHLIWFREDPGQSSWSELTDSGNLHNSVSEVSLWSQHSTGLWASDENTLVQSHQQLFLPVVSFAADQMSCRRGSHSPAGIHFRTSRLHYCNCMVAGPPRSTVKLLQDVLTTVVWLSLNLQATTSCECSSSCIGCRSSRGSLIYYAL